MPESKRGALYGFKYTRAALDGLRKIEPKKVRQQVKKRIDKLASNPRPRGTKPLTGIDHEGDPVYRVRQGDHRVLYVVRDNPGTIIVLDIGDRKDVCRGR